MSPALSDQECLTLTLADPERSAEELALIREFVAKHPSDFLASRAGEEFKASISDGLSFRIQSEFEERVSAGAICAQSAVFDRANGKAFELGATLVAPDYRGFGLQKLLTRVRLAHLFELDENLAADDGPIVYTVVRNTNSHSAGSMTEVGLYPASHDHPIWRKLGISPNDLCDLAKTLYVFQPCLIEEVYKSLERFVQHPVTNRNNRGLKISFGPRVRHYGDPGYYATKVRRDAA